MSVFRPQSLIEAAVFQPALVQEAVDTALRARPGHTGVIENVQAAQDDLLVFVGEQIDLTALSEQDRGRLTHLTRAGLLLELSEWCREAAVACVSEARTAGARWQDVALAVGYASPSGAAQRFDPAQQVKARAAAKRKNERRRAELLAARVSREN